MDDICADATGPTRIACQKLPDHKGERHGFDLGFMSAAWGYVPTESELQKC